MTEEQNGDHYTAADLEEAKQQIDEKKPIVSAHTAASVYHSLHALEDLLRRMKGGDYHG